MSVSIELSNKYLYIVEGRASGNGLNIEKHLKLRIKDDVIDDGLIRDVDYISDFLKETFSTNEISTKEIGFVLSTSNLISRHLTIPMAKESEMMNIVKMEVLQVANLSINYMIDYAVLSTSIEKKAKHAHVVAYAVDDKYIVQFVQIAKKLNLKLSVIDVCDNAMHKCLSACKINEEKTGFIVTKINSSNMLIILYENGKPTFSKVELLTDMEKSVSDDNESISDKGEFEIIKYVSGGYVAATPIDETKHEGMYEEDINENFLEKDTYTQITENKINIICNYISKVLQYFNARNLGTRMEKIYILGEGSNIEKIDERISDYLGIPVFRIEKPPCIKSDENMNFSIFIDAIGGIIRR